MSMKTPDDLFLHELQDIYDAEHRFAQALPKMAESVTDERLRAAFEEHAKQTQGQIANLEKCFKALGKPAKRTACYGSQGLVSEYEHFAKEGPAPEVLTLFSVGAAQKVEEYEICSYKDLSQMAELMGQDEIAQLLQENLKQEQATAQKLETIGEALNKQTIKQAATA